MQSNGGARTLLSEIESFCRHSGMAESTFGRQAVNDGKLCTRLRSGKDLRLDTAARIRVFIEAERARSLRPRAAEAVPAAPAENDELASELDTRPFRFYDNRQKYLAFVSTCNEKWKVAERAARELTHLRPTPPALRVFDAGIGDGTVMSHLLRAMHRRFPTMPFFVVGKEISLEDVRLSLEKLPDRLIEHPASVIAITNLHYAEAPSLSLQSADEESALNWREVALEGQSAYEYGEQLRALEPVLADGWQVKSHPESGNPIYTRPSVLIIYRRDQRFVLDGMIPRPGGLDAPYDLVLASQPWRARMGARFKVRKVLGPLVKSLGPSGRLLAVQSYGRDAGLELVREIWPDENPFTVNRHALIKALKDELGRDAREFNFNPASDAKSILRYEMHTLPSEIGSSIGTSTLLAAWNAAIYVAQIEDERLASAIADGRYLDATARTLKRHGGLWFNDESFVVSRRHASKSRVAHE